jgi:hypothetical protein
MMRVCLFFRSIPHNEALPALALVVSSGLFFVDPNAPVRFVSPEFHLYFADKNHVTPYVLFQDSLCLLAYSLSFCQRSRVAKTTDPSNFRHRVMVRGRLMPALFFRSLRLALAILGTSFRLVLRR